MTDLDSLIARLDQARGELESADLSDDARAELLDRLAKISVELGTELDRRARATQRSDKTTDTE